MIILIIFGIIIILFLVWHYTTKSFINPYKLTYYFGKKGSGKTTLLVKHAYEYLKKGRQVYSTEYVKFDMADKKKNKIYTLETIPIKATDIPFYPFPAESVILIDEISLTYSNRDFSDKDKKEQLRKLFEFLQLQRRNKLIIEAFSVTFEGADKRIRDLCDDMYLVNRWARVFVFAKHLIRKPIVVHPTGDAPATIQDDILGDPVIFYPFGGIQSAFIPFWSRFYHSFLTDGENIKEDATGT